MSSAGHIFAMIASLKANRRARKTGKFGQKRQTLASTHDNRLNTEPATPEQLQAIHRIIEKRKKREQRARKMAIGLVMLIMSTAVYFFFFHTN